MAKYDHKKIEKKWQKKWAAGKIYKTEEGGLRTGGDTVKDREKCYVLDMFPYPSGEGLHVGHPKGYIATDIYSRFKRMSGFEVLHPMGWDAFGLPAENYAIKNKTHPRKAVEKNIKRYKEQLSIIGFDYDWSREINTTDPAYYKWTQWIFLKLYERGLAYESHEPINWCPSCQTGLANEDLEAGKCERCGSVVEKRPMRQWVLKITDYAERLLADLDAKDLSHLPSVVDKNNPPMPGKKSVARRTVHALVIDPKTGKILCIKWKKFPWTGFVIGGVEDGEDIVEAARREVQEETGYTDLKFKKILGGMVKGEYFAAHKGENRIAYSTPVLFELKSDRRVPVSDEEKNKHDPIWLDPRTLNHQNFTCAELDIWLARMSVDVEYSVDNKKTPLFTQTTDSSAFRAGLPIVERNAVAAIVKHWSEDKYIGLKWKKVDWKTLITGGPEKDQTPEKGAIMEIIEETGYKHPKFIKKLGNVDAKFFHVPKNLNRLAHFDVMYFELADGEQNDLSAEERENHEVVWLTREEMSSFIGPASQKYMWDTLFLGRQNEFLNDDEPLIHWPESVKESQKNWIGKSQGMLFTSPVKDTDIKIQTFSAHFEAFAADTFVAIAPDHPLLPKILEGVSNKKEILDFADKITKKRKANGFSEEKELEGIFTGRYVVDPVGNGDLPIWIASYALADYGTGIVKCSCHDERDFKFAKKYDIKLKPVLFPEDKTFADKVKNLKICFNDTKNGILREPKEFDGKKAREERKNIISYLEKNKLAVRKTTYRLKDWVFSRQRYWGEPIPMIHCEKCGTVPVPEKDLPVKLPEVKNYEPTGTGESPLAAIEKWVNVKCPKCRGKARRETNTMPQWAGSSWYYLRFMDPKNRRALVDPKKEKYWNQVDVYVGGDHAVRHLIYARFWHKFLHDIGAVSTSEPFKRLEFLGFILAEDGRKMSKRFGNVINPDDIVHTYGADTLRVYEMFMSPFSQTTSWDTKAIMGSERFVERVFRIGERFVTLSKKTDSKELLVSLHRTIKKVTEDIENFGFNTAISSLMILSRELEQATDFTSETLATFLKLCAPFMPHVTEEIWMSQKLAKKFGASVTIKNTKNWSIHTSPWPTFDPKLIEKNTITIVIQINGKVRDQVEVMSDIDEKTLTALALKRPEVKRWLNGREVKKTIFVKDRILSFVV